jgi:hypothetical protein
VLNLLQIYLTEAEEKRGNRDAARSLRAALQPPQSCRPCSLICTGARPYASIGTDSPE